MDARARPPLRLSVEERVEHAVKEAVRRALDEQRRTQERELDTLSDALQRSLATLAGERDRALRSLAAEEEKRQDTVDDLSMLLGDELSCADVTRLVMGIDKIEQEGKDGAGAGEDGAEEVRYGRTWVLEQLRECLRTRAAAQDHLRLAVQESATDLFEAEEFMGFEPGGFSGQAVQQETPIFAAASDGDDDDDCEGEGRRLPGEARGAMGVARARAAASEALRTSLRLARERVEYIESLAREVQSGGDGGGGDRSAVGETKAQYGGGGLAVATNSERSRRDFVMVEGVRSGVDRGSEKDGLVNGSDQEEGDVARAERTETPSESDCVTELRVDGKSLPLEEAAAPPPNTREQAEDGEDATGNTAISQAGREHAAVSEVVRGRDGQLRIGAGKKHISAHDGGGGGVGDRLRFTEVSPLAGAGLGVAAGELGEAKRWRMAARRAEASLADLRETFGDALALSFRCGEDHSRQQAAGPGGQSAAGGSSDGGGGRGAEGFAAGKGGSTDEEAVVAGLDGTGGEAKEAVVSEGSLGTCWGRRRCSSCEARTTGVGVLLERLQALSAEQGRDVAQMEASLDILRHAAPTNAPKAAISQGDRTGHHVAQYSKPPSTPTDTNAVDGSRDSGLEGVNSSAAVRTDDALAASSSSSPENVAAGGGDSRGTASPTRDIRTEWEELEELDTYLAHYRGGGGLGSPEVQGVLDRWIDVSKRRILEGWLAHVVHGGPVDSANGCFVPRVQMSSLSKEVRDGLVSVVLPLLLGRRGVLLQVLTRERVELVHDIQIRVTPVAGRRDAPANARAANPGRRRAPVGEREHGARIRDMVMKAAHAGYVEEEGGRVLEAGMWRTPLASVDSLSRQLKDTWESFNANFAVMAEPQKGRGDGRPLPDY